MSLSSAAAGKLLAWFDGHRRELPWRKSVDPYRIWISEIMLQQTQVDRVVAYFERFIERFPTVGDLAAASVDEVLASWSGLGYYRRARQLHAAARQIVADGAFPSGIDDWRKLPGVGPYTAAAVVSIAFGTKVPAIDGNVERVLSRLEAIGEDVKRAKGRRYLQAAAQRLLDERRPGDSNQAIMELGATVCRSQKPHCTLCPLSQGCVAYREGTASSFPMTTGQRPMVSVRRLGVVVESAGRTLLFRRPEGADVLAGLWEVPWIPWVEPLVVPLELASKYGGDWSLDRHCGEVRHAITHRDIRLEVWRGRLSTENLVAEGSPAGWFSRSEMGDLATSSLVEKMLCCAAVETDSEPDR